MAKIVQGDLWKSGAEMICVTTCGTLNKNQSCLVMGAGAARGAAAKYPSLPSEAAVYLRHRYGIASQRIVRRGPRGGVTTYADIMYGFVPVETRGLSKIIGLFQTKRYVFSPATLSMIGYSIVMLNLFLEGGVGREIKSVALNFPGIGLGGLPRDSVLPLLNDLDPRVTVYEFNKK